MGDDNLRNAGFSQFADNTDDLGSDFWIERRRGFIKEQNLRFHHQGAGNGHALLLAAGKMQRVAIAIGSDAATDYTVGKPYPRSGAAREWLCQKALW